MLDVWRYYARELGQSALTAVADGVYVAVSARRIDWREKIERAKTLKQRASQLGQQIAGRGFSCSGL
jgi:hypothetical protein